MDRVPPPYRSYFHQALLLVLYGGAAVFAPGLLPPPAGMFVFFAGLGAAAFTLVRLRRRIHALVEYVESHRRDVCLACNYRLSARPAAGGRVCPECGTAVPADGGHAEWGWRLSHFKRLSAEQYRCAEEAFRKQQRRAQRARGKS